MVRVLMVYFDINLRSNLIAFKSQHAKLKAAAKVSASEAITDVRKQKNER